MAKGQSAGRKLHGGCLWLVVIDVWPAVYVDVWVLCVAWGMWVGGVGCARNCWVFLDRNEARPLVYTMI